jgi:hypothetical protein
VIENQQVMAIPLKDREFLERQAEPTGNRANPYRSRNKIIDTNRGGFGRPLVKSVHGLSTVQNI